MLTHHVNHTIQVMGKNDQGHEADFSQWSLPEQFIEMLLALLIGTRVSYLRLGFL